MWRKYFVKNAFPTIDRDFESYKTYPDHDFVSYKSIRFPLEFCKKTKIKLPVGGKKNEIKGYKQWN